VLARIEKLDGVEWTGVEATGSFLAVRSRAGADVEAVAAAVAIALGGRGRAAESEQARSQLAALGRGDPWFGPREVHALSYVEGRLVAVRVAARVAQELELDPEAKAALAQAVREVFFGVLERVHAEGGRESSGWFYAEWPEIARAVGERMANLVPDAARLAARVAACHARS